jgi:hypothetical protein
MFKTKRSMYVALSLAALATLLGGRLAKPVYAQVKAALVRDIDNPALQPVTFALTMNKTGGVPQYSAALPPIPAGKRLVIETISLVDQNPGTYVGIFNVISSVNGVQTGFNVPLQYNNALQVSSGTLAARLYADAAGGMFMLYQVQNASDANKYLSVSGYYITL